MKANEIQLTAEELELIKVAREKKEQEQLAKQKKINDRVDHHKQVAMKAMLIGEQQVKATYDFFKDFKSGEFEVVEYPITKTMDVKDYDTNEYYFKEDYIVNSAYIQHKETQIKIRVEEHSVWNGWRSKNKGYKMFCSLLEGNRAYSKVSTIEEKVLNEIKSKRAKQNAEEIRNTYVADLIETQPIPNAKIGKTYIPSQCVSIPHGIEIKYDNGVVVECSISVTHEGEAILSVYSTRFPKPKLEGETVMDKLKFISKLEF
jgi:hypothetical protein